MAERTGGRIQLLKKSLTEAPVLTCPDFTQEFVLQTDASDLGLRIALTQSIEDQDGVWFPWIMKPVMQLATYPWLSEYEEDTDQPTKTAVKDD
ncbi:hypothetical protein JTB14_009606 [Gonioctena quinquepunctata]|nr:hypothetical protein JTB14_009606 [Gonioctena quinquepunctata]